MEQNEKKVLYDKLKILAIPLALHQSLLNALVGKYDAVSVFFATWCFAIPVSLIACYVLEWPVLIVYMIMCLDEVVKVPFLKRHYKKYIWVKNLTRETNEIN